RLRRSVSTGPPRQNRTSCLGNEAGAARTGIERGISFSCSSSERSREYRLRRELSIAHHRFRPRLLRRFVWSRQLIYLLSFVHFQPALLYNGVKFASRVWSALHSDRRSCTIAILRSLSRFCPKPHFVTWLWTRLPFLVFLYLVLFLYSVV
ncbi:unnamed protein product, partial [Pylaiella littoralis]